MTYLKQTIRHTEETDGNCWATALACLCNQFEIPTIDVRADDWFEKSCEYTRQFGYDLVEIGATKDSPRVPLGLMCIMSGKSPRQPGFEKDKEQEYLRHVCIGEVIQCSPQLKIQFIHDPSPADTFIETLDSIIILIPKV